MRLPLCLSWTKDLCTLRRGCEEISSGNFVYFGTVDNYYLNTKLPTIGQHIWAHVGDDNQDKFKDDIFVEDTTLQILDVCQNDPSIPESQPNGPDFQQGGSSGKTFKIEHFWCMKIDLGHPGL